MPALDWRTGRIHTWGNWSESSQARQTRPNAACGAQNDRPQASWLTIAGLGPLLRLGLVGGAGGSLSRLGDFGGVQAEGAADRGKSLPAAAAAGAAA
jgi:hypothetical protein